MEHILELDLADDAAITEILNDPNIFDLNEDWCDEGVAEDELVLDPVPSLRGLSLSPRINQPIDQAVSVADTSGGQS